MSTVILSYHLIISPIFSAAIMTGTQGRNERNPPPSISEEDPEDRANHGSIEIDFPPMRTFSPARAKLTVSSKSKTIFAATDMVFVGTGNSNREQATDAWALARASAIGGVGSFDFVEVAQRETILWMLAR